MGLVVAKYHELFSASSDWSSLPSLSSCDCDVIAKRFHRVAVDWGANLSPDTKR